MIPGFDILRIETNGDVLWLAGADSLEDAKTRIRESAEPLHSWYVILNHKTGNKLVIQAVSGLHSPPHAWEKAYQDAFNETDRQKLIEMVAAAETAIAERLRELGDLPEEALERAAIKWALDSLLTIKNRTLKASDWKLPGDLAKGKGVSN